MKEFVVCADIASKRDRYAEMVLRRKVWIADGSPVISSPDRVLSELQVVWMKQRENLRYEQMEDSYMSLINRPELLDNCDELVDGTGVGDAVVENLRKRGAFPVSIVFTSGGRAHPVYSEIGKVFGESQAGDLSLMRTVKEWMVPKRELVSDGVLIFEQGRIAVGKRVAHREAFQAQLTGFVGKVNEATKRRRYEAESEELHDDLITCFLMAAWWVTYFASEIPQGELVGQNQETSWDPLAQFNSVDDPQKESPLMSLHSWR